MEAPYLKAMIKLLSRISLIALLNLVVLGIYITCTLYIFYTREANAQKIISYSYQKTQKIITQKLNRVETPTNHITTTELD